MTDIPVFLFTGFLDSGKTTFIQSVLADPSFNKGQRILVLQCEEGEEELDPSGFASADNVFIETVLDQKKLTEALLDRLTNKYDAEQVVVEYNGMWLLTDFFQVLPREWVIAGETMFADSTTFLQYNANMRQLVFNKMNTAEMIVFNRVPKSMDRMELHKIVRGANRQAQIVYSDENGKAEYDEIVDPLPFDVNAPVIEIEDKDYALFYADLMENTKTYIDKTVSLNALALSEKGMPRKTFAIGRQLMQCCAEDIQFAGLACLYDHPEQICSKRWYKVEAKVIERFTSLYGRKGPVLVVKSIKPSSEPEEPVATFY
ncbi:MAG: hypothetical protein II914_01655 [Clostridia bacterium]|nr:hypothetical protein [Clostridia bacterium]MBQ3662819.1 hypothetical protein [Clostridia bacterium]MBQ5758023.1 hypothetical protein [Clostridia bacterium]